MAATQRRDDGYEAAVRQSRGIDCPDCLHRSYVVNRWNATTHTYEPTCDRCGRTRGLMRRVRWHYEEIE